MLLSFITQPQIFQVVFYCHLLLEKWGNGVGKVRIYKIGSLSVELLKFSGFLLCLK